MSKAKWFAVRKPCTGEIIATSANQIVPPKFRGPTKILYYIHQTPLSSCSVEGGSGAETIPVLLPAPTLTGLEREQQLSGTVVVAVVLLRYADFSSYLHYRMLEITRIRRGMFGLVVV